MYNNTFDAPEINLKEPAREDVNYKEDLGKNLPEGLVIDVLDFAFEQISGKGFWDTVLEPIAGNYNSIKANGEAWGNCKGGFIEIRENLTENRKKLLREAWTGEDAAEAFKTFLTTYWETGALWVSEKVCGFLESGFTKIGEWSLKLAKQAAEGIARIIELVGRLAAKLVPGRMAKELWDWIWHDRIPGKKEVDAIISIYNSVEKIYNTLRSLPDLIKAYLESLQGIVDALGEIPKIGSIDDAIEVGGKVKDADAKRKKMQDDIKKKGKELKDEAKNVEDKVDEVAEG